MKRYCIVLSVAVLGYAAVGYAAPADTNDNRTKLAGSWRSEDRSADTWVIEENGDDIRISHATAAEKPAEIECNSLGRECELKLDGKKGTVSMYFNGSKLVQLETRGSEVVKRRFTVAPNGDTLEVEIIPVVPAGTPKVLRYSRTSNRAASK